MLSLTRKTEYALIAVCHLAHVGQKVVSAREIAEQHGMPLPLLMNVLKKLNRTGHVRSIRGARGGYVLAVSPEEFTLDALIEAVEGPVHLVRCTNADINGRKCTLANPCPIRKSVRKVHELLRELLNRITVADFAYVEPEAAQSSAKAVAQ
ncbi:MAG: Rrf2 family transcriptional regulator [Phycisphaerae bacterium]|nr:Rrf2 family transcriptional regulator [Phycisphaerae bacterium]